MMFHQLTVPEAVIWLRTGTDNYSLTPDAFSQLFGEPVPQLEQGVAQRIYEQDKRHPLIDADDNVIDGGPVPWPEGDAILARADVVMQAWQAKEKEQVDAQRKAATEKRDAEVAAENARIADDLKKANDALIPLRARRAAALDKLAALLRKAGGSDQEVQDIIAGLWPTPPQQ
jgi:hypothetical protein